ncbi:MAG TPA: alpha-glucosidase [Clostridia bacterium]|nr:alpha-glucosidase [Clostridia bacterium]
MNRQWWKEAVVYQIYPRSFNDSNGDGIGDIPGIIEKLDYIKSLGVDVIWLNPVYQSPNYDNGYDISDYRDIMDAFGSLEDWEKLLEALHNSGIKLIMDLVVNHSSFEHQWFLESKKSKDNPYRDYYIWKEGKNGEPPNNWETFFSGSVWTLDEATEEYYLHLFTKEQPDLNWENPKVRAEVYDLMKFWLDKGIDGFRMDVINLISKDQRYPNGEVKADSGLGDGSPYYMNGPRVHEYLKEMNTEVLSKYDIMTVGETPGITTKEGIDYTAKGNKELNMVFQFEHMTVDYGKMGKWTPQPFNLKKLKDILTKWQIDLNDQGWNSLYFMNHDQPRTVSRFGDDENYREESAKLLAMCLLSMKGTPYIYQGEEIGMTNYPFEKLEDCHDVEVFNRAKVVQERHLDFKGFFNGVKKLGRDNSRTPMQWDNTKNAGFTSGKPWLAVNPNYKTINVLEEQKTSDSILSFYKKMIQTRKNELGLVYGNFEPLFQEDEDLFVYKRLLADDEFLVILNFSQKNIHKKIKNIQDYNVLITNYRYNTITREAIELKPYEGIILKK